MKFAQENYSNDLVAEMMPLWKKHYEEIALYKDIPLSPDLNVYKQADALGMLAIFTARLQTLLVGYEVMFVSQHPHYKEARQAVQDILFLDPSMRVGLTGYKFIHWCDEQLREKGVQLVMQHVKDSHDFSPLLKRMGYEIHDHLYSRRLK